MSDQPTVFAALMNQATDGLHREVDRRLSSEASQAARAATRWVQQTIREAYAEGVRDGFVQGVAAEVARANGPIAEAA